MTTAPLRARAVRAALFPATTLDRAVAAMDFVQYDPIRGPARAQDLILRQRVVGYREGDLERAYPRLGLEEGYLHVYGAMTRRLSSLVDPRCGGSAVANGLAADVLSLVRERGIVHAREVAAVLGRAKATNAWGGTSTATTRALDELHRGWLVRVVRRDNGTKLYAPMPPCGDSLDVAERARGLTLYLVGSLMPIPLSSLRSALVQLRRRGGFDATSCPDVLLGSGELVRERVEGVDYVSIAGVPEPGWGLPSGVRLLAPFDPLVWDRRRFEHLWGWPYRFEAYVPAERRRFGYYSLPVLQGDTVVGWAGAGVSEGLLFVRVSFPGRRPELGRFRRDLAEEAERLARVVGFGVGGVELE